VLAFEGFHSGTYGYLLPKTRLLARVFLESANSEFTSRKDALAHSFVEVKHVKAALKHRRSSGSDVVPRVYRSLGRHAGMNLSQN